MSIEIHRPELERRVGEVIQSGRFQDADELLTKALDALRLTAWRLPFWRRLKMLILFDHSTPAPLSSYLTGHTVIEAKDRGWDQLSTGDLLTEAERAVLKKPLRHAEDTIESIV